MKSIQTVLASPFVISKFRYYISNIAFIDANNKEVIVANSYYLINEADSLSKNYPVAI